MCVCVGSASTFCVSVCVRARACGGVCVCVMLAHMLGKSMLSAELEGQALLPFPGIVVRVTVGLAGQSGPILISPALALFPFLDVALCASSTATLRWPGGGGVQRSRRWISET